MRHGTSLYWLLVMAVAAVASSAMMLNVGQRNRAWLRIAAKAQKQMETLDRLHKEEQKLSGRLSAMEAPTRLLFMAKSMHMTLHWRAYLPKMTNKQSYGYVVLSKKHCNNSKDIALRSNR